MHMKRILIVDDVIVNRKILKKNLKDEYDLVEASNGLEALEFLKNEDETMPDLILLDIVMPIMDGYQFLERLANEGDISNIPVIITTQKSDETSELKALLAGAIEFITMPYNVAMINQRIKNIISLREQSEVIKNAERNSTTGLLYGTFLENELIGKLHANPNIRYDIVACKIENFKTIEMGAETNVIKQLQVLVTQKLLNIISDMDVLGQYDHDTFILMMDQREDYEELFYSLISEKYDINGIEISIKLKFGIYKIIGYGESILDYIEYANHAVSQISGKYGQFIAHYDDKIRKKEENEQFIVNNMQKALDENQFLISYIPQFDIIQHKLFCLEIEVK